MSINSRRKGARGENEFIKRFLVPYWPEACRNLDQYGPKKNDCLNAAGAHWQIKRAERADIWSWIRQADEEAAPTEVPIVAFRRNRSDWYCVIPADELVALLRLRESA